VDVFSVMRSKESIDRADVAVLMLDAKDGVTRDDMGILRIIDEKGKACIVMVNKWDLAEKVEDVTEEEYKRHLIYASDQLKNFPISFISAKTGKNIVDSLSVVKVLDANLDLQVSTPFLNNMFKKNDPAAIPISRKKKRPNFLYMTQTGRRPLEFAIFVNDPANVLPVHISFIENKLRESLPLQGIPVKIKIKRSRRKK
jgi:GTP-binding protein